MKDKKSFGIYGFPFVNNGKSFEELENCKFAIMLSCQNYECDKKSLKEDYFFEDEYSKLFEFNQKNVHKIILDFVNFIDDNSENVEEYDILSFLEFLLNGYFYLKGDFCLDKKFVLSFFDKHLKNQTDKNKILFVSNCTKELFEIGYIKLIDEIISYNIKDTSLNHPNGWYSEMEKICNYTGYKMKDIISYHAAKNLNKKAFDCFIENLENLSKSDICHILRIGMRFKNKKEELYTDYIRYKSLYEISEKMN